MAILKIVKEGEELLRKTSRPVTEITTIRRSTPTCTAARPQPSA